MTFSRILLCLALVPMGVACSHDDGHHDHEGHAERTSGDEHTRVATRDRDHDGTTDTAGVQQDQPTAMDQGENASDVEITRQIRSAVVGDSSLSFGARNCTIITNGGNVTLRGDVTGAESDAIERHAHQVAGVTQVTNSLTVTDATH